MVARHWGKVLVGVFIYVPPSSPEYLALLDSLGNILEKVQFRDTCSGVGEPTLVWAMVFKPGGA